MVFVEYVGEHSNFKNFLRTRKIMVMHSNEREECSPRTLVDRKRKRYDNAVDVVVCLHDRPILLPKVRHLHELRIQQSVEGELRQHDGVVTILMFYRCRASLKHRYDIIEVYYGGGGTAHG